MIDHYRLRRILRYVRLDHVTLALLITSAVSILALSSPRLSLFFFATITACGFAYKLTLFVIFSDQADDSGKLILKKSGRRTAAQGPRNDLPEITIIMPVRNTVRFLRDAVKSAIASDGVKVTVMILDDASTDGSAELGRQLQQEYEEVIFRQSYQNLGPYFLRNVGLAAAKTEFVGFLDSDDVHDPSRLRKQVEPLLRNPKTVATYCRARRWTLGLERPVGKIQRGYITPVFRKSLTTEVGFFDSVFFGGDAEFRHRLIKKYGPTRLTEIPEELYKLRFREGSLTTSGSGKIFGLTTGGHLVKSNSAIREKYERNYREWHQKSRDLFMPFPLRKRPFEVGKPSQSSSPFLSEGVRGFLASFPERDNACREMIDTILDQVDELHLHLNGFKEKPDWAEHPRVTVYLMQKTDHKDRAKFLHQANKSGYLITLDDDIRYPDDYVSRLLVEIELTNRSSVVGVHGITYGREEPSLFHNRDVEFFWNSSEGRWVDALGTGTIGHHSTTVGFGLSDFPRVGVTDMYVSQKCRREGVPMFSVPREAGWLSPIETPKESRIYRTNLKNQKELDFLFKETYAPSLTKQPAKPWLPRQNQALHIVVTGWNCEEFVDECLDSIGEAIQAVEGEVLLTVVDDGSTDKTREKINAHPLSNRMKILRNGENRGSAYSRHLAILQEEDMESIVVLVDMDDCVTADSLARIHAYYSEDSRVWMTLGNWRTASGGQNPQDFYSPEEVGRNAHRSIRPFNGTHLRTFKRFLYERIPEDYLKGEDGKFLRYCSDVALVFPLLDQCGPENVRWVSDPIYVYRKHRETGTIALSRLAGIDKGEIMEFLAAKPALDGYPAQEGM
jgi:glycosyltransferase involved in cell wall biosynthesis